MATLCEQCADCDEWVPEYDCEEIAGEFYCATCALAHDEDEDEDGDVVPRMECGKCRKRVPAKDVIEKLPGYRCAECAHKYEVEILGFDDIDCTICDHKRAA